MINKKQIHYIFSIKNNKNYIYLNKTFFDLVITTFVLTSIRPFIFLIDLKNTHQPINLYSEIYNINLSIKTNFLFLFTLYIIYNKLSKCLNLFSFKFATVLKKKQKFTVLRAPCNHKNSKEQFGSYSYKGKIKIIRPFLTNRYFHNYFLYFFFQEKQSNIQKLQHTILINENK